MNNAVLLFSELIKIQGLSIVNLLIWLVELIS